MRHLAFMVLTLCLSGVACGGSSAEPHTSPSAATASSPPAEPDLNSYIGSPAWVREKIEKFRAEPSAISGAPIVAYAEKNSHVAVVLRPSLVGHEGLDEERHLILVAAFIAGNIEAQLGAGKTEDMPVPGVRMMLTVYAQMKEASPQVAVSKLEGFQKMVTTCRPNACCLWGGRPRTRPWEGTWATAPSASCRRCALSSSRTP